MSEDKFFQEIREIDRVIHEPARLAIMAALYTVREADFRYLLSITGLTKGNLSAHASKLEESGYIEVEKKFVHKKPMTIYRLTDKGRQAFSEYLRVIKEVAKLK